MKYVLFNENLLSDVFNQKSKFDIEPVSGIVPVFENVDEYIIYRNLLTNEQFDEELKRRVEEFLTSSGRDPQNVNDGLTLKMKRQLKQELEPAIQDNRFAMLNDSVNNEQEADYFFVITSQCPDISNPDNYSPVIHALVSDFEASRQIANEISKNRYGLLNIFISYANGKNLFLSSKDMCIYDSKGKLVRRSKQYYKEHPEEIPSENEKQ